ncbi:MAG: energy-coupling factor transporter ATPase [Firmicutes bacterium]|nr:energy-coupling factor transporter ATPase [Bacillota bacterium]
MPIKIEGLSYIYSPQSPLAKQALWDINLEIADGEFVGLIGHTGSGKSTLIQHLNGLIKPMQGKVVVDEFDLTDKSTNWRQLRQKVGMVFQYPEHQLFGETVYEDVAFGPKNLGISEAEIEQRVIDALKMVDLDYDSLKDRSPFELSGGQKRRIAIAGVLAMRPRILILDEPTAGLDPRGRDEILDQVKRLHTEWDLTVILVTHSMEDIARLATRLIVLEKGRVALDGTPYEVFANAEELSRMGLGVPQVTALMSELSKRGLAVKKEVMTIEDAEQEILKIWESK